MTTPTIIIGIGSSGLHIINHVQNLYFEHFGTNKPPQVEYIYLETNEHNQPTGTPVGNNITNVVIGLDDMSKMIRDIQQYCNNPDWLPDIAQALDAGLGAGGIRSCGRLALWGTNQQGDNFERVISAISNAYARVTQLQHANSSNRPAVFVTGSLTGGTGAGIFIDIAYLVRRLILNVTDLYGLFLLPKEPQVIRNFEVIYGNAYGAIKDLEYFNNPDNAYKEMWPNGWTIEEIRPPYEFVQFISQDYQDGNPAIRNLDGLYKLAGMNLFLNIAGIYPKRRERLVDAKGSSRLGKYGSFGLSAIEFPKSLIKEYTAIELGSQLLSSMINAEEYCINNQKRPIPRPTVRQSMELFWDATLSEGFKMLGSLEGASVLTMLEREVAKIHNKQISSSLTTDEYIISLFNSSGSKNFYAIAKSNIPSATKWIVDTIYQEIDRALTYSQNLYYAYYTLQDIVTSIDQTLNYWRSIGSSSQANNWDGSLFELASGCTTHTYKEVFQHDEVLRDRMQAIFEMLKIHLFIKPLIDVRDNIKQGIIKMRGEDFELPRLNDFKQYIAKTETVIGKNSEQVTVGINLAKRTAAIIAEIEDTTLPILRVYPSNSFSREVDISTQTYYQRGGALRNSHELIGDANLFSFFQTLDRGKFTEDLYLKCLTEYKNLVGSKNCIQDYDVAEYIATHPDESIRTAKRATSPFLKIDRILPFDPAIPRFIIAAEQPLISTVLRTFQDRNYNDFKDTTDGKMAVPSLTNIVIFYDEKGKFEVRQDLSYIQQLKDSYENVPKGNTDPALTKQRWINNRNAYSTN